MAEKLVRNKIIDFSQEKKDGRVFRVAKQVELPLLLSNKLMEECTEAVRELISPVIDKKKLMEEIVDCLDVLEEIASTCEISVEELGQFGFEKTEKKGNFSEHRVMEIK